jgi:glycosyltransferase involved in cell wall biosynthesis
MDSDAARVAMLHQDPHPAHRGFAEAVGVELVDYHRLSLGPLGGTIAEDGLNGLFYPDYDVYLVEGSRPLYAALARRFTRGGKVIYLAADHGLYELGSEDFEGESGIKSLIGRFGRPVVRTVGRQGIDGVIAVSEFVADFTRPFVGAGTPIRIAHPFVQADTYESLGAVDPDIGSDVVVTVARPWDYKGVDMLVDAWSVVRSEFPEAELRVVGRGHPDGYEDTPGVRVEGYIENLADAFAPASLFVQPSRVDAFPVSTLEAMRAGVPPLVTDRAGTRSEVGAIDETLVVNPSPQGLAHGVQTYLARDVIKREQLSGRARERGAEFDPDTRTAAFREAFRDVLKAL